MNRWPLTLLLFFASLIVANNPVMAGDNLEVLSPPDKASVGGRFINIVCKINQDVLDTIKVTSNYRYAEPQPDKPVAALNVRIQGLSLQLGENMIKIQGLKEGRVVQEKVLSVFRRSSLSMDYVTPPPDFKEYIFHTPGKNKYCFLCHENELKKGAKSRKDVTMPACYTCHRRMMAVRKNFHGPAAVWACDTCHTESTEQRVNGVPDPEVNVCRTCHTEEVGMWQSETYGHGPTMTGKCTICHDPHGSDENFFLKKESTDLCGNCHADKLLYPHVISGYTGKGHPVKLDTDKYVRRHISCASCHNPHAENNHYLLVNYNGSMMDFCHSCHIRR